MAFWPAGWRNNLPWAGASDAFDTISNLPDGGQMTAITNYLWVIDDSAEKCVSTNALAMDDGTELFEVDGPILITGLVAECIADNDGATASTLQFRVDPVVGAAVTISEASAVLTTAVAGATVSLIGTALDTQPVYNTSGANLAMTEAIVAMEGKIDIVVGTGNNTGTWRYHLRYKPLLPGTQAIAA